MSLMTGIAALLRDQFNVLKTQLDSHTHDPADIDGLTGVSQYVGTDVSGNTGVFDLPAANIPRVVRYSGVADSTVASGGYVITSNVLDYDTFSESSYSNVTGTFQPNIAGYYRMSAYVYAISNNSTVKRTQGLFFKNATSSFGYGARLQSTTDHVASAAGTIYLNGTTDYVQFNVYLMDSADDWIIGNGNSLGGSEFCAELVR